jgi:uncharacterized GH25 family protein
MLFHPLLPAFVLSLFATSTIAHEFWIEPQEYQVQSGAPLLADLRNGQQFEGSNLAYFAKRTERFELIQNRTSTAIQARMGDVPALQTVVQNDGLLVILHETTESTITYTQWDKFRSFTDHKGFPEATKRHKERGLPQEGFKEVYRRFAKALVGVGTAIGVDSASGMETEFVALANPYTDDLSMGFPVSLFYQNAPRINALIEVFDRGPDDAVEIFNMRTDAMGHAMIPVKPGHTYLLDAVVLREPTYETDAVWESLWAAMTFYIPLD